MSVNSKPWTIRKAIGEVEREKVNRSLAKSPLATGGYKLYPPRKSHAALQTRERSLHKCNHRCSGTFLFSLRAALLPGKKSFLQESGKVRQTHNYDNALWLKVLLHLIVYTKKTRYTRENRAVPHLDLPHNTTSDRTPMQFKTKKIPTFVSLSVSLSNLRRPTYAGSTRHCRRSTSIRSHCHNRKGQSFCEPLHRYFVDAGILRLGEHSSPSFLERPNRGLNGLQFMSLEATSLASTKHWHALHFRISTL